MATVTRLQRRPSTSLSLQPRAAGPPKVWYTLYRGIARTCRTFDKFPELKFLLSARISAYDRAATQPLERRFNSDKFLFSVLYRALGAGAKATASPSFCMTHPGILSYIPPLEGNSTYPAVDGNVSFLRLLREFADATLLDDARGASSEAAALRATALSNGFELLAFLKDHIANSADTIGISSPLLAQAKRVPSDASTSANIVAGLQSYRQNELRRISPAALEVIRPQHVTSRLPWENGRRMAAAVPGSLLISTAFASDMFPIGGIGVMAPLLSKAFETDMADQPASIPEFDALLDAATSAAAVTGRHKSVLTKVKNMCAALLDSSRHRSKCSDDNETQVDAEISIPVLVNQPLGATVSDYFTVPEDKWSAEFLALPLWFGGHYIPSTNPAVAIVAGDLPENVRACSIPGSQVHVVRYSDFSLLAAAVAAGDIAPAAVKVLLGCIPVNASGAGKLAGNGTIAIAQTPRDSMSLRAVLFDSPPNTAVVRYRQGLNASFKSSRKDSFEQLTDVLHVSESEAKIMSSLERCYFPGVDSLLPPKPSKTIEPVPVAELQGQLPSDDTKFGYFCINTNTKGSRGPWSGRFINGTSVLVYHRMATWRRALHQLDGAYKPLITTVDSLGAMLADAKREEYISTLSHKDNELSSKPKAADRASHRAFRAALEQPFESPMVKHVDFHVPHPLIVTACFSRGGKAKLVRERERHYAAVAKRRRERLALFSRFAMPDDMDEDDE